MRWQHVIYNRENDSDACLCVRCRTGLKARAGAAWVPVSSKYFSHEKLFGCLYSEEMEHKQVPPISHSQHFLLLLLKSGQQNKGMQLAIHWHVT